MQLDELVTTPLGFATETPLLRLPSGRAPSWAVTKLDRQDALPPVSLEPRQAGYHSYSSELVWSSSIRWY